MKTVRENCFNYELILEWKNGVLGQIEIDYAQDFENINHAILRISADGVKMAIKSPHGEQILKTDDHVPQGKVVFLRRGNYARVLYDGREMYLQGGTGEWYGHYMAEKAVLTVDDSENNLISCLYTSLDWLIAPDSPAVTAGEDGTYYEQQIIPGSVIEHDGVWYMYCMCGMKGNEEGSSKRVIGVATSTDLINWTVMPKPLIDHGILGVEGENLYPNACLKNADGKFVLFFSAQAFPKWIGVYALISDSPLGPFVLCKENPVIPSDKPMHEFDAVECNLPQGRYLLYLTTYQQGSDTEKAGDRGILYFSDDLIHWRKGADMAPFRPETENGWDFAHVRTRGINKIGDTWYLWYEGVGHWPAPKNDFDDENAFVNCDWWDVVGLARSKDLKNWEYYHRNPCFVPQGRSIDRYDSRWVGWPRMVIKDGKGYIFHSASGKKVHVGCRTIDIDALTDWETEGGKTEKLI